LVLAQQVYMPVPPAMDDRNRDTMGAYAAGGYNQDHDGVADHVDFAEQVEQQMRDVRPEDIVTFELGAGERRAFVLSVQTLPVTIKGAYIVSASKRNKIHFHVFLPNGTYYIAREQKKDAVFVFQPDTTGDYTFEFANRNVRSEVIRCSTL
jgi:hypothetical protein